MSRPFDIPRSEASPAPQPSFSPCRLQFPRPRRSQRGRRPKWTPHAFTDADLNRGMQILKEWGPNHQDKNRVIMNFEICCHLSGMDKKDPRCAIALLGQMVNSGLGPGSCDTYIGYIHKRYKMFDVLKAASARHADFESKHAPDVADEILWRYVVEAKPKWQPIFYLLYTFGLRPIAIRFLCRHRIYLPSKEHWGQECIEATVAIDKTRKRRALRATLSLPLEWDWILPPPSEETWSLFTTGDPEERLFEGITASHIDTELRTMANVLQVPRPTTYSFRRGYINRIFPLVRNKAELTQYTLHFDVATVNAFYKRTRDDLRRMQQ